MRDLDGNPVPVMVVPARFLGALIYKFLLQRPVGDAGSWITYVVYMCIPAATELLELYESEHGEGSGEKWVCDMYEKTLLVNPLLSYNSIGEHQEPVEDSKVVYVNFNNRRKYGVS
jgi:hypothetical protein